MTKPTSRTVRTRFAPSPTGYLHLGGARTALFSWAFAKHFGGDFILRIEDTDLERSTPEAVQAILDGMQWLGLEADEGPFYQMQRMDRYREVISQMLKDGSAYYCYSTPEEVDAMREKARSIGAKPRYDGTWRPERGKQLPPIPAEIKPVVRFKCPQDGVTSWNDLVKGPISIANSELDDLVIARPDGTPTYNFCVVVDDWDMGITDVIRGDDHVNNTPRQINILHALGAELPNYGHVPMILGPDGEKLSKRHGAVSVMEYDKLGYLPEAMVNYLARLGWSHGNDELFTKEQFVEWFDTHSLSKSAAQWDPKKLNWVNASIMRNMDINKLAARVKHRVEDLGGKPDNTDFNTILELLRERSETLTELAENCMLFCGPYVPASEELKAETLTTEAIALLKEFHLKAASLDNWQSEEIGQLIKTILKEHGLKMPKLAIPLRVAVTGRKHTPSINAVLALIGQEKVLERLAQHF